MRTTSIKAITKSELIQKESKAKTNVANDNRSYSSNSNWITTSLLAVLILGFGILTENDIYPSAETCIEKEHAVCQIDSLITQVETFSAKVFDSRSYPSTTHLKNVSNELKTPSDSRMFLSTKFLLQ